VQGLQILQYTGPIPPTPTPSPTPSPSPTASPTPTPSPTPFNDASIIGDTIPDVIPAGHIVPVAITVQNTGTTTWTNPGYSLSAMPEACVAAISGNLGLDPSVSVEPGGIYTFNLQLKAGTTDGACGAQFQMTEAGMGAFGGTLPAAFDIVDAVNGEKFLGSTLPAHIPRGAALGIGISLQNTGNTTWTPEGGYALSVLDDPCSVLGGANRIEMQAGAVAAPGEPTQFLAYIQAPDVVESCAVRLQLVEDVEGAFGAAFEISTEIVEARNSAGDWEVYQ